MTDGLRPLLPDAIGANPSFSDLLARQRPAQDLPRAAAVPDGVLHGTTIIGMRHAAGIVMAGDRQATAGYYVADARIDKVFVADDFSAIGISGSAGMAVEMVRLFQLELEHYEKITGDRLSLDGKANRLAQMLRGNLGLAMQGFVVVPLFGGYDLARSEGRIFNYDPSGGRWEDRDFHAEGSGGRAARGSLGKLWRADMDETAAIAVAVEALIDASREDVATGGPDPSRGIYPTVVVVDAGGARQLDDAVVSPVVAQVLGRSA